jgi:hypothetical protein
MAGAVSARPELDHAPVDGITPFFPEWVVPLQPEGTGRPVFVFPPSHNLRASLAVEARVADHAGRDHPFWGFGCDDTCLYRVRAGDGVALAADRVRQMRTIQGDGPYLLYGVCFGAYAAWETARQLLEAGDEVAGIFFYEAPLRSDYDNVLPGPAPAHSLNVWRLSHYYRVQPLPVHLTHVMTRGWHGSGWWKPWQEVALGSYEPVIVPGETETAFVDREERIARHVREWIETAEHRTRGR